MSSFCLVLHTHLPYVRRNGVWPSGEDFFHQAAIESYLPVIGVLGDLHARGMRDVMTMSVSPMVAHQMADPFMGRELELYLGRWELRALRQVSRYEGVFAAEFKDLAAHFAMFAREQSDRLDSMGTLTAGLKRLQDGGVIELLGGPATHPFLPLITEPALARAQLSQGLREHERHFGNKPKGIWLPECAYDPNLSQLLDQFSIEHFVVDGPTMLRSAGPGSTFAPRRVRDGNSITLARDLDVSYRVWSPTGGYPTGKWYRDFFHYDVEAGFKNWRVTSIRKPLEEKRPYEPARATAAARADAEDFAALIVKRLEGRPDGVVVAAYDTELFGHWWFEGPAFLQRLFEVLADSPVRARTLASALETLPEPEPVDLVAGTWGFRKDERSWVAPETQAMWEALTEAEAETVRLLEKFGAAEGARQEALKQLVREAMLLQSSDWPFMILRGRNPDYARERFDSHRARWNDMAGLLKSRAREETVATKTALLNEADNILPALTLDDFVLR